ncbi:MAG: pilus assembly protein PilP [Deltaproteobacteria bacterium]|nr:pilus assembly protein PilP [Deltaproteobacteria bacterium]
MQRVKKNMRPQGVLFIIALIWLISNPTFGAQDVVYKEPKPLKEVTAEAPPTETGNTGEKKTETEDDYIYDPTGKTDPFKSFITIREEQQEKKKEKPKTYLETLELSQLNLIMITIGKKGKWAMVRDSKGDGYVIKEGTAIGTNGGVVYKIAQGEVIIREEYTDFRGQKQYRDITKKTQ